MMKKEIFEYFLYKLVKWHCEYYHSEIYEFNNHAFNDLSKLKVLKLHFFTCSTNRDALNIFNEFHAMPYGHVESDVYSYINNLQDFNVTNSKLQILKLDGWDLLDNEEVRVMDRAIESLKEVNVKLIALSPFELVELSHRWFSWRYTFYEARKDNVFSRKISTDLIEQETKIYSL